MSSYDIFGDIHGHAHLLKKALKSLGYRKTNSGYAHSEGRRALFTGDLLNRGTEVMKTVKIVRRMIDNGQADMILGNHEFDFVAFHSKDKKGRPLLKHDRKSLLRLRNTHSDFDTNQKRKELKEWLLTIPIFIETEDFRAVHACWQKRDIAYLTRVYPDGLSNPKLLRRSCNPSRVEYWALHSIIDGPKLVHYKDDSLEVDVRNPDCSFVKVRWWDKSYKRGTKEMAIRGKSRIPNALTPDSYVSNYEPYGKKQKPLFFGHYCLREKPHLIKTNLCCLDFCADRSQILSVYSYDGEQALKPAKLSNYSY